MFERFAAPTRRVLVEAEAEARELGHHFIDTHHLVLGLLVADPDTNSAVRAMLLAAGLDSENVGRLAPGGRQALDAAREAAGRPDVPTGTQHLLLGVLGEPKGLGAKVLESLGVATADVEAKIAELGVKGTSDGPLPARVIKVGNG